MDPWSRVACWHLLHRQPHQKKRLQQRQIEVMPTVSTNVNKCINSTVILVKALRVLRAYKPVVLTKNDVSTLAKCSFHDAGWGQSWWPESFWETHKAHQSWQENCQKVSLLYSLSVDPAAATQTHQALIELALLKLLYLTLETSISRRLWFAVITDQTPFHSYNVNQRKITDPIYIISLKSLIHTVHAEPGWELKWLRWSWNRNWQIKKPQWRSSMKSLWLSSFRKQRSQLLSQTIMFHALRSLLGSTLAP